MNNYKKLKIIGKGTFGKALLVRNQTNHSL